MEKKAYMGMLMGFYANLLTQRQKKAMELYCLEDYSLAEIAEHEGITRQGVRDALVRAEQLLNETEQKLGFVQKYMTLSNGLYDTAKALEAGGDAVSAERIRKLLDAWEDE